MAVSLVCHRCGGPMSICALCSGIVPLATRDADELTFALIDIQSSLSDLDWHLRKLTFGELPEGCERVEDFARRRRYDLRCVRKDIEAVRSRFYEMARNWDYQEDIPY